MLRIEKYQEFFNTFTNEYVKNAKTTVDVAMLTLKQRHTCHVRDNMVRIASTCHLTQEEIQIAEVIGLFHDIGRFKQYATYHTYDDKKSVNHAKYSVEVLNEEKCLEDLDQITQAIIYNSILYHNVYQLEESLMDDKTLFFAKMIRDADRLDIYRDMANDVPHMSKEEQFVWYNERDPKITDVSDVVFKDLMEHQSISLKDCVSVCESQFARLSWIFYDINFKEAFQIIQDEHYFGKIYDTMVKNPRVIEMYEEVTKYLNVMLQDGERKLL